MHTALDDAQLVVAQLLYLLEHMRDDGELIEVPPQLCDLGGVELTPEGVQQRLETLVAGASQALLTVLDLLAERGLSHREALREAALRLAAEG